MGEFLENTTIVVLDDDPTGTQTVQDIPVLTTWGAATLEEMFRDRVPLFYILTNTRAFSEEKAVAINVEIGSTLKELGEKYQRKILPISRSDSTLRGHFPAEVDALSRGLSSKNPLVFIIPAFIEGGRFTIGGVHYLMQDGVRTPVAETPFAQDPVFAYTQSDLTEWVLEKSAGSILRDQIVRVSPQSWAGDGLNATVKVLLDPDKKVVVCDAENYDDLNLVSVLIRQVMHAGREVIIRSAASIVKALGKLETAPFLKPATLLNQENQHGGLVVVGSFVPLTTRQLTYLTQHRVLPTFVVTTADVAAAGDDFPASLSNKLEAHILSGETVLMYTQRKLETGTSRQETIDIGKRFSDLLVEIVKHMRVAPAFMIAKGGITSSDLATQGLGIKKAMVKGQVVAGVSVWQPGEDSRLSGFPYVVFPGNVGNDQTLYEVVQAFAGVEHTKTDNS
jgi:uncharacterized protein YgbK (DUF1537 family)